MIRTEHFQESILPFVVSFSAGVIFWFAAPFVSKWVSRDFDDNLVFDGLTPGLMYSTVFIGLGTYFALSSFGQTFNWVHYFATRNQMPPEFGDILNRTKPSFYDMSEPMLTLLAGVALICLHRPLSKKLTRDS